MLRIVLPVICFFSLYCASSQGLPNYTSLDKNNPIHFLGGAIIYQNDTIQLGPKHFFIDGQLSKEEVAKYPFVYNSINEAAENLTHGTENEPMTLFIAPYVYWIDNPDDPDVRVPLSGSTPYGLIINCEWLTFYGLTKKPENVVVAANRGQTIGARGNFTLFRFHGEGTRSENLTFGNYCNVDLEFPLMPSLNRKKRASAIVQAQLIHCDGDKIVAKNTRFISRLNLCPFVGGKRVFFEDCHFESTDDALCGTGVYLNSTFEFFSSKPFYWTRGTGSVFLNCDINAHTKEEQYFTKANGQLAIVDTRFTIDENTYIGWNNRPPAEVRNYQYNVSKNGGDLVIGSKDSDRTVNMEHLEVLNTYRFTIDNQTIYNIYNLLKGDDEWDPLDQKEIVLNAEKTLGEKLTDIPMQLLTTPTRNEIETGKDTLTLTAKIMRFGNYPIKKGTITWTVNANQQSLVKLLPSDDGITCQVIPTNTRDSTLEVLVTATTNIGLEAASLVYVAPKMLPAPGFKKLPRFVKSKPGVLLVDYELATDFTDQSFVTWYRCLDKSGSNPIEVAVTRFNEPYKSYRLTAGDIGYYLMAGIAPNHLRCEPGASVFVIRKKPITKAEITSPLNILETDFKNLSSKNQPVTIPGFWTLDHFSPETASKNDAWQYGQGQNGAENHWGFVQGRSAILSYTPNIETKGSMKLTLEVAPFKSAGQGFSIADLYMDVLIKYDAKSKTGYGLRFIRTTKFHNAVDCLLIRYLNGEVTSISKPVATSAYRTTCMITVEYKNGQLLATAKTIPEENMVSDQPGLKSEVLLKADVSPGDYDGFGIQYNGGASALLKYLKTEWSN